MREITIAGGGLAGLSLAAALRANDVPVTVLEAGNYPRHRVCGEFISGVSDKTLENLGIARLFDDARRHRTVAWYERGKPLHRDSLPEPALGISRHVLDERLKQHVETLGGRVRKGIRARPEPREGFVWAAGRRATRGRWIGLKAHVRGLPMAADLVMHAGRNGYAGLAEVEDGWVNVCGLFFLDRRLKSDFLLSAYLRSGGNPDLAAALEAAEVRKNSLAAVAGFQLGRQRRHAGLLSIGDAESMIPPFTGNGMSMAFQSAELALAPLVAWSAGHRTWEQAQRETRTAVAGAFRRRLAAAACLHPLLLHRAGRALCQTLAAASALPFRPMLALVR